MAQEKARSTRARKKPDGEPEAVVQKKTTRTDAATPAAKKPATTRKPRKTPAPVVPATDAIAELAYLLWERGEPGDQTEHWLRAESELRAA